MTTFRKSHQRKRFPMLWLVAVVVTILLGFAALFEIDQTVRAQGQVVPGIRTQVIQAVDGGMLTAIHVHEGDTVKAGQKVAEFEPDRAQAGAAQSRAEVDSKRIALIRARAELAGTTPVLVKESAANPEFVAAQLGYWQQRKRGLEEELSVQRDGLKLANDELAMTQRLFASGDISQSEVMRAQRQVLDIQSRINGVRNKYFQDTRQEVTKLEDELANSRYKLDERSSILQHTDLVAPTDGVVKYVRITTLGGVLKPGDELMQVSPVDDELLIELKVNPSDVGQLTVGLPVSITFDAFDSSLYGKVLGTMRYLSPDTLTDQGPNGQSMTYYRAQIAPDWKKTAGQAVNRLKAAQLKPGMTATADIRVGQRTILYYLAKPIIKAFSGALSER
jgi:adhesin transport system membrane fusion protein